MHPVGLLVLGSPEMDSTPHSNRSGLFWYAESTSIFDRDHDALHRIIVRILLMPWIPSQGLAGSARLEGTKSSRYVLMYKVPLASYKD